ncbi:hypothetical protein SAMN05444679_10384 [Variovorax sp. CF079]|uniref:SLOG domain-containing protein n=1 Tax=Variovorax sp. CF079 TaxID=1882774 RepID=UPI000886DC33|nr:hypothetical protein [Variovorax sp. CF079]SDC44504.1 hypothetical protein SAMN05444679_10384 [Variovorax sp. CF079]
MTTGPTDIAAASSPIFGLMLRVADVTEVEALLDDVPSLLLSASVPYALDESMCEPKDVARLPFLNQRYVGRARPDRIRAAISALTRVALNHELRLVFGAHPAISPMVLQAARDMRAQAKSIVIFQSAVYAGRLAQSTLALAQWDAGVLIMTADQKESASSRRNPKSLEFMRKAMVRVPGLLGAVFVGGMQGVEREAQLFQKAHPRKKRYAIASTGSAAESLADDDPNAFRGTLSDPSLLADMRSYSVVARRIVLDLLGPLPIAT